jgi:hypothetical protein
MKSIILPVLLSLFSTLPLLLFGQNNPPEITNVSLTVDTLSKTVTVDYDLADAEDTEIEVWMRISALDDNQFFIEPENTSGDIGFPVNTGSSKSITWNYGQDDLSGIGPDYPLRIQLVADDKYEINIQELVNQVDSNRLKQDMAWLEGIRHRTAGLDHLQATKDSLLNRFLEYGLDLYIQPFPMGSYTGENIQGLKSGLAEGAKTWIIDAHYDSVSDSPGADDNASGTAGFLEISRILSQYEFEQSIKFMGFDAEEAGLIGSINYVLNGIPLYEDIQGVFNLEMIGYYSDEPDSQTLPFGFEILFPAVSDSVAAQDYRGNFLANIGNENSQDLIDLFNNSAKEYVPQLRVLSLASPGNGQLVPDLRRSDHAPFWDAGYQALMLTNTSEFRNDNYHEPTDLVSTLNFEFMTNVVKATLAAAAEGAVPIHAGKAQSDSFTLPDLASSTETPAAGISIATLGPIRPNPGHSAFQIPYQLEKQADVRISIFSLEGKEVRQFLPGQQGSGAYTWNWDGSDQQGASLSPGLYFVRLEATDPDGIPCQLTEKLMIAEPHRH